MVGSERVTVVLSLLLRTDHTVSKNFSKYFVRQPCVVIILLVLVRISALEMSRYLQSRPSDHVYKLTKAIRVGNYKAFMHSSETEGLPSARNAADFKLLKKALIYGRTQVAHTLLNRGCRVYNKFYNGNSPLHIAATRRNCGKLVRRLLANGARVDQKNRKQETPLHLAFAFADGKVIDLMLNHHFYNGYANESNRVGLTYLHIAAARAKLDIVMDFVETEYADVNCQIDMNADSSYAGFTPLHMAVGYGQVSAAELLLNYGADLWTPDFQGSTPLHLALERKDVEMIELLLTYDHKIENCVNDHGLSHFMATCVTSNASIAIDYLLNPTNNQKLLINGVVDKSDDQPTYTFKNYTPLHFAAEFGRQETVQLLLDHGADCRSRNANGSMPLHLALKNGFEQVATALVMHCLRRKWSSHVSYYVDRVRGDELGYYGDDEDDDCNSAVTSNGSDEKVVKVVCDADFGYYGDDEADGGDDEYEVCSKFGDDLGYKEIDIEYFTL